MEWNIKQPVHSKLKFVDNVEFLIAPLNPTVWNLNFSDLSLSVYFCLILGY